MNKRKLKLSVNPHFDDKHTNDSRYYSVGFENTEFTIDEISEAVNLGVAYSYQYRDGVRKSENFIATDYLAVDIDYGMTLEDAKKHPIVKQYCSMIYVTPSHTPDDNRFRLFFALPRTITKISDVKSASRSLTRRLGDDMKATDAARMFYGSKGSNPMVYKRLMSSEFLDELIQDGLTFPSSESLAFGGSTASRSSLRPDPDMLVITKDGKQQSLKEITKTTSIYCPFHNDHNPSAFVSQSNNQSKYIHCSKCQQTWYVKGSTPYERSFNDFDNALHQIKKDYSNKATLVDLIDCPDLKPEDIIFSSEEYIVLNEIQDGLTLIKSPKGTGKTTYLASALSKIICKFATLEEYEENDDEGSACFYSKEKILLIGHRKALIGELCQRLSLNNYQDDPKDDFGELRRRKQRYGVCLDSLHKVEDEKYDVILIDEVEQVLSHFLSDTIGESRRGLFKIFSRLLGNAKKVVALDADLGWVTYTTLSHLTKQENDSRNQKGESKQNKSRIHIYINEWKPENRTLHVYKSVFQLIHEIKRHVVEGKRIFITANSKAKIKSLTNAISLLEKEVGSPIPLISITSENSSNKESQHFIKNIKTEILKYKVILSSPSLGTGIDITFENGKSEIDAVFGLFENQINTHFEIDQQLARVRNPKSIHVWVSPRTFNFETEFRVVARDFLHRHLQDTLDTGYLSDDWDVNTSDIDPFLKMAALTISHQRASKNRFKENFLRYRQEQNWTINFVKEDELLSKEGRDLYKVGKDISEKEWIDSILNARVMNRVEYEKCEDDLESNDANIPPEDWYSYYRTRLELFYRQEVTESLIKEDKKGQHRREILMFENLRVINPSSILKIIKNPSDVSDKKNFKLGLHLFKNHDVAVSLLYGLLSSTPIFKNGTFDSDNEFTSSELEKFSDASIKFKEIVHTQLDVVTQSDVATKSAQHLNKLLSLVGLNAPKSGQSNVNKNRTYFYKIDTDSLDKMTKISNLRDKTSGWDFVNSQYKFVYSSLDLEWISSRKYPI